MLNFNHAIQSQLNNLMSQDSKVMLFGLGLTDPKRFFGTCNLLVEKYGTNRVYECPTSENAYLGHAFGLSLSGYKPIVHFQRMDFMLYAFDQLINSIAKWNFMFDANEKSTLVIRTLIGQGWGQGAQHSQNFSSFFAQEPGLIVLTPTCPKSASDLLQQSLLQDKPVIFVEHRWLQYLNQTQTSFDKLSFTLGKSFMRKEGNHISIVAWSYSVVEAMRFSELFPDIDFEIIDLLSLSPLDIQSIKNTFTKTKNLIIWEPTRSFGSIGSEIIAQLNQTNLTGKILKIGNNFNYPSASPHDANAHYPSLNAIVDQINQTFNLKLKVTTQMKWPNDKDLSNWSPWS